MKRVLTAALAAICMAGAASAQELFTGDKRLACEALLCLSSSAGTSEPACQPSLRRYFSITKRRLRDTIRARGDFLKLCPTAEQTPAMRVLVDALAAGAGWCDAATFNATLGYSSIDPVTGLEVIIIGNVMPTTCMAIYTNPNTSYPTDLLVPRYVGLPERGGLWADPADYERLLAEYEARVAAEGAARAASGRWWN